MCAFNSKIEMWILNQKASINDLLQKFSLLIYNSCRYAIYTRHFLLFINHFIYI